MITFCYREYKVKNWGSIDNSALYVYSKHIFKTISFLCLLISVDVIHEQNKTKNISEAYISSITDC